MSINIDEDYIDIFLMHNNKKVNSNSDSPNYHRIITKEIGVKDDFQELNFKLVNDIDITINIKFKNKFSVLQMSVKDRLKFFNQPKQEPKKTTDAPQHVPKKIKMPDFLQKDNQKKEEEIKKPIIIKKTVEPKKVEEHKEEDEPKKIEEHKKEEESKKQEEAKKEEEIKIDEEPKNVEENKKEEVPQNMEEENQNVEEQKPIQEENKNEEEKIDENEINNEELQPEEKEPEIENKIEETKEKQEEDKNNIKIEETKKPPPQQKQKVDKEIASTPTPTQNPIPEPKIEKPLTIGHPKNDDVNVNKNMLKVKTFQIPSTKETKNKVQTSKTIKEDDEFEILDIDMLEETNRKNTKSSNVPEMFFLQPTKYTQYLEDQKKRGIKHPYRETFCEGFFIASFPKKDGKVIEFSTSFPAPCRHAECSELPAMKPEIIYRYPLKDTKTLELNNLAATICFPTGIKVCYDENTGPNSIKDYVTSITNQKGERYYMTTYHFYLKIPSDEYVKQYDENPLKYNLRKFADAYTGLSEEELTEDKMNIIQEKLEFSQELGFRDYVFVPFCICLISKYPYVQEMQKCLKSIYTIIKNGNNDESNIVINNLIMYLINAIPIPAKKTQIKFLVPYQNNCIDINCPKLDDINIMNLSSSWLLKYFSIDNIILIFKLLITEKKILLIDNDYERLSTIADALVSILYPFQWIHTYIPIMSDQMLKYLETFLPFLNGINESLMSLVETIFKEGEVEEDDEVFLIYIRENKIKLSSTLKGKNKKFDKYIQDTIPPLPQGLEKELKSKLRKARSDLEDVEKKKNTIENKQNCELEIRDAFIDFFVEMFQDYAKYLSFIEEDPVFNKSLFLEKKPSNERNFYNDMLDTQLFQQFTQNVVNEDVNYFNNKINMRELGKKKEKKKILNVEKEYCINPDFLKLEQNSNNLKDLIKESKEKYPEENFKINSLILENSIEIDEKKYDEKNLQIYFTPEELQTNSETIPLVEMEDAEMRNPRKMTNSGILQKLKAMNLKAASTVKKKEGLSEKEKDNIKETIKDYVVKIFRSEDVNLNQKEKTDILNKLNLPFGREFFISLLSKNYSSNIILLKENSFHLLWYLIYNPLIYTLKLEETDKVLEDIILLVKCTTYFGIQEEGATISLFEKNIGKIRDFAKIKQANFWQKWYDLELKKNEKMKNDIKFKQNIIYDICRMLIILKFPKSTVKNLTDPININEFGKGTDLQQQTFKEIIRLITEAKYISEVI